MDYLLNNSKKYWKYNIVHLTFLSNQNKDSLCFKNLHPLVLYFITQNLFTMNVNIQSVHFDADLKLIEYVERKLDKLQTFHDRIVKVDVFLKLDNVVHHIKDKIAEIKVHIPKHDLFVKTSSKSFEESFDEAFESIVHQIKKQKEKQAA